MKNLFKKTTPTPKTVELSHVAPLAFDEAKEIAQLIKDGKAISIDFSGTSANTTIRLVDFLTGTLIISGGAFQKISSKHYILAPSKELAIKFANQIKNN